MLIITVETHPANVNFLVGGPLDGPAVGELARTRLSLGLMCVVSVDGAGKELLASGSRSVVLRLEGTLRAPVDSVLRSRVESLLQGGVRRVLLDLSGVSNIDAAGVGELIHLYNTAAAAGGVLEIWRMSPHVRRVLDVAGVLERLDVENPAARSTCP
jgi:anti-sigma B factor antagonist